MSKESCEILLIPFNDDGTVIFRGGDYTMSAQVEDHHVVIHGKKYFLWRDASHIRSAVVRCAKDFVGHLNLTHGARIKVTIEYGEEFAESLEREVVNNV